jgi:uncharacterized protein (UPF0332 family)
MGNGLSPVLKKLLEERKVQKIPVDRALVEKELVAAGEDLKEAGENLALHKYKWATIQAYYAIFHCARALLFKKGFREKSHHALLVAIRELYEDRIERALFQDFEHAMYLRQEADYGLKFSRRGAEDVHLAARAFIDRTKAVLDRS